MKPVISITTKTGDKGQSGLANGERVSKADLVFEVVGTLDELNSWLGLIVVTMGETCTDQRTFLLHIQETLFYVGAEVARSPKAKLVTEEIDNVEKMTNALQEQLADNWHTKFVLPGGSLLAAQLDIARTVCRRAERCLIRYSEQQPVSPLILRYLNRLSDCLYMMRCFANDQQQYEEKQFISR